jgi:hypothetical protein
MYTGIPIRDITVIIKKSYTAHRESENCIQFNNEF